MSSDGIVLIGDEEEFDKIGTPMTGYAEMFDKFIDTVSGATGIPKTRLFGQQLGTLAGATETTRDYYDFLKSYQKKKIKDN